jgi:hypothetical protein
LVDASAGRDVRLRGGNVTLTGIGQAGRLFLVRGIDLTLAGVNSDGTEPDDDGLTGVVIEGENDIFIASGTSGSTFSASGNRLTGGSLDAGTSLTLSSGELAGFTSLKAGTSVSLAASGLVDVDGLTAGTDALVSSLSGDVRLGSAAAGRDLNVQAAGMAALGTIEAGDDVRVRGGTVTITEARATGRGPDTGEIGSGDGSNIDVAGNPGCGRGARRNARCDHPRLLPGRCPAE